jgi:hypothetical protein
MILGTGIAVGQKIKVDGVWHTVKEKQQDGIKTNKGLFVEFGNKNIQARKAK